MKNITAIIEGDFQGGGLQDFNCFYDSRFFRNRKDSEGYLNSDGYKVEVEHSKLMIHTSQLYSSGKAYNELKHGEVIVCVPHSLVGSKLDIRLSSNKTCDKRMNVYTIIPEFWDWMEVPDNVKVVRSNFIPMLEKIYAPLTSSEVEEGSACIFINRSELPNKYLKQYKKLVKELNLRKLYFKLHPTEPKSGSLEQVSLLSSELGIEVVNVDSKVDPYSLADSVEFSLVGYTSLRVELWLRYNFHFRTGNKVISLIGSYDDEIPESSYVTIPETRYDLMYRDLPSVREGFMEVLKSISEKENITN